MSPNSAGNDDADRDAPSGGDQAPPRYLFSKLSHGGREVHIEHEGHIYRLRLTKNGKLILNK